MVKLDTKYLLTCKEWFYAPDGEQYRAVHGTVSEIINDEGNKYIVIGNVCVKWHNVDCAVMTEFVSFKAPTREIDYDGESRVVKCDRTRIYNADKQLHNDLELGTALVTMMVDSRNSK